MPIDSVSLIADIGFPIAAFIMMYRFAVVTLERNTIAVGRLAEAIAKDQPRENADWVGDYEDAEPANIFSWPGRNRNR